MEVVYEYKLVLPFKAESSQHVYDSISAKADCEEILEKLLEMVNSGSAFVK